MLLKVLCALCVPAFMSLTLLAMFQSQPAFRQPLRRFSNVCACRLVFHSVIWRMAFAYISSRVLGAGELGNGSTKLQACGKFNLEISNVLLILQPPHQCIHFVFFFFFVLHCLEITFFMKGARHPTPGVPIPKFKTRMGGRGPAPPLLELL